jgi:hypothetical protein
MAPTSLVSSRNIISLYMRGVKKLKKLLDKRY